VRWFNPDGDLTASEIANSYADYLIRGLLARPEVVRTAASATEPRPDVRKLPSPARKAAQQAGDFYKR
jgi:hypothetical protein